MTEVTRSNSNVMNVTKGHNPMFCHRYPTSVVSGWDNVSSSFVDGGLIVRSGCDCQPQGGWGLGLCDMVNKSESLINVVSNDKRKRLTRLGQKASGQGQALLTRLTQTSCHRRRGET